LTVIARGGETIDKSCLSPLSPSKQSQDVLRLLRWLILITKIPDWFTNTPSPNDRL